MRETSQVTDHLRSTMSATARRCTRLQEIRGKGAMQQWLLSSFMPFPDYHEELEWLVKEISLRGGREAPNGSVWAIPSLW